MEGWRQVELQVVATYVKEKIEAKYLNASTYVSTENMIPNIGGITLSSYVPEFGKVSAFKTNDILVSNIRPYFKKIWKAKYAGGCSNDILVFRYNSSKIFPGFLYYQLVKDDFFDFMMAGSNGTKMPRGNRKLIPKFQLSLPPLLIQKKITNILSAYDNLIENNLKRIKLLEELAQITYEEWFVRMRFPGHENISINPETGLPESWERKKLGDVTDLIKRGISPKYVSDNGVMVINQKCIRHNRVNFSLARQSSTDKKIPTEKFIKLYDILVNSTGTGTLGRVAQCFDDVHATVDSHVTIVRANNISSLYLGRFMEGVESFLESLGKGATNQKELSSGDMASLINIVVPSSNLQKKYHDMSSLIYKEISNLITQNALLQEAREILLPRLMTGLIDVEQYDPAKLLEKEAII